MWSTTVWIRVAIVCLAYALGSPVAADSTTLILPTAPLPPSHMIDGVPLTGQWWNLSCEYAATSAATGHFGKPIGQSTFVDAIGFDANPNKGFRGNLSGPWGGVADYGVYPGPILSALVQQGFAHSYIFRADPNLLRHAISNDRPVVVWLLGTSGNVPQYESESGGERFVLVPYEHAVTVYGYNETSVSVMDPAYPTYRAIPWEEFQAAWMKLDGMALAVAT